MLSKGKNFEVMCVTYNHGDRYLFCLIFLPLHANPLHAANFAGDKNVAFDFSADACLFGQPFYDLLF